MKVKERRVWRYKLKYTIQIIMLKSKINLFTLLIAAASLLFTGCSFSADGHDFSIDVGNNEKEYSSDEIVLDNVKAVSTEIVDNVGTVTVSYSGTATAKIDVDITASGRDEDKLSEILEVAKVKAEIDGDELKVSVVNKDTDENIWEWIERKYHIFSNKPNLEVDLDIELPNSIQEFDITSNVGDINLDSLKGRFDIISNVGSIDVSDMIFIGDSEINGDVGDISCSLNKDMEAAADISIVTNIGEINVDTNGLSYTVDNHNDDDENFLGSSKTINVEDFCTIDTEIEIGKLELR